MADVYVAGVCYEGASAVGTWGGLWAVCVYVCVCVCWEACRILSCKGRCECSLLLIVRGSLEEWCGEQWKESGYHGLVPTRRLWFANAGLAPGHVP